MFQWLLPAGLLLLHSGWSAREHLQAVKMEQAVDIHVPLDALVALGFAVLVTTLFTARKLKPNMLSDEYVEEESQGRDPYAFLQTRECFQDYDARRRAFLEWKKNNMVPEKRQSVAHKVYVQSTRAGNAVKVYHEQYLRTDIPCSSKLCPECAENTPADANGDVLPPVLSATPRSSPKWGPHYVLLDTNIVLRCIDLIEHPDCLYDVIVPQTVLEEVRHRSLPVYSRLRAVVSAQQKRVYVFHNEFHRDTAVQRQEGESINDKNDRAIRQLAQWYNQHLKEHVKNAEPPLVLLLTNDRANAAAAVAQGIPTCKIQEYLEEYPNAESLLDMSSEWTDPTSVKNIYPAYYPRSATLAGIKNKTMFSGRISISKYNCLDATVNTTEYPKPLLVLGHEAMNRAFDGDQVVVELLPKAKWKRPLTQILDEDEEDQPDADEEETETLDAPQQVISETERRLLTAEARRAQSEITAVEYAVQPTARVVAILKRNWRFYVGHIQTSGASTAASSSRSVLVKPLDRKIPRIRIKTRKLQDLLEKRIVVAIDDWPAHSKHPEGHFVKSLGDMESQEAETEALLMENDIEYRAFSKDAIDCLPQEGHDWKPSRNDPKRQDLTHLLVCSIDPPRCQDIDDALHAYELPSGNFHVGVHIADVTHFVKADTALDLEGASRGTSTYLVDKRIDMLPALLGTDLCSLRPNVERYAFSVLWELDQDAKIVSTSFTKSLIRSRQAFEYSEAQARIDDDSQQDDLSKSMRILLKLSKKLRHQRMEQGALNLASPEIKILMESETADPGSVEVKKILDTNSLVEEFMLLANISVARKIHEAYPLVAMLRRHPAPPPSNFDAINDQLYLKGLPQINIESSKAVAESLDKIQDPEDPFINTLIRIMATRCMVQAQYFAAGMYSPPEFRHYGLASEIYTHFTSPIRRYADIVAHRQLAASIGYEDLPASHFQRNKLEAICDNINRRNLNAQLAGRASIEYFVSQILKKKNSYQEGYIIKVFSNGIGVLVPAFGLECIIGTDNICKPGEYKLDENTYTLEIGGETPRKLQIFDKVKVYVESVKEEHSGKSRVRMTLV